MIGERVRLAREACLLTQLQLSEASGVSQATLSQMEAGRIASPSLDAVAAIALATNFPESFFALGPLPDLPDGHYRKLKRGTSKVTRQVRAQVRQVVELVQTSEERVKLPPLAFESVSVLEDLDEVERIADRVRLALGVGARDPIPNLTRAIERAGVVLVSLAIEMRDHDGFSVWPDYGLGGRPIIAVSRTDAGDRNRFTLAHELGHLVLHTTRTDVGSSQAEKEAHRFAGALLIPKEAAQETLSPPLTLQVLKEVKATFGVSIAMGARRAFDLGMISKEHYVSLNKQLSARGWRRKEPIEVGMEEPLLLPKMIALLAGGGSVTQRAERVHMPTFAFRALAGSMDA